MDLNDDLPPIGSARGLMALAKQDGPRHISASALDLGPGPCPVAASGVAVALPPVEPAD